MHINGIGYLNTIPWNILFFTKGMIKNRKMKKIEYVIKQVSKLYLQCGLKTARIHDDSEFEPIWLEVSDIWIYLNWVSKT